MTSYQHIINNGTVAEPLPLSLLDKMIDKLLIKVTMTYDHVLEPKMLMAGLEKLLSHYPHIGGSLVDFYNADSRIIADDKGILFSGQSLNVAMDQQLKKPLDSDHQVQMPAYHGEYVDGDHFIKVTCSEYVDGTRLEMTLPHFLCDGFALTGLLIDWANLAKGGQIQPLNVDKSKILKTENSIIKHYYDSLTVQPMPRTNQDSHLFYISESLIDDLMAEQIDVPPAQLASLRNKIWMAYVWQTITASRAPEDKGMASIISQFNMRGGLGLGHRYFGNAITMLFVEQSVDQVLDQSLSVATESLGDMFNQLMRARKKFLQKTFTDLEQGNMPEILPVIMSGAMLVNDMTEFPLYDIDFGHGRPSWVELPMSDYLMRQVKALPAPDQSKGVVLNVSLPEVEMARFIELFGAKPIKSMPAPVAQETTT
ncbi:MAG: hypothetical protein ACI8WB_004075 [Phenylobacterium sp.]|jgi:hypothetical protein